MIKRLVHWLLSKALPYHGTPGEQICDALEARQL
jgi:hypothetical protein